MAAGAVLDSDVHVGATFWTVLGKMAAAGLHGESAIFEMGYGVKRLRRKRAEIGIELSAPLQGLRFDGGVCPGLRPGLS
jgi:hypothetical protein